MQEFLLGSFALVCGAAICFSGLRVFFVLLPIWGFFAGFFVGAIGFQAIFGDGFLSTVTGWVIGFFIGLAFAAISYVYWYIGAIVAAGSVGALLGSGLFAALGVDAGWFLFLAGMGGAILFAFAALVLALPVYIVIVNTAFAGAAAIVTGAMLLFNRLDIAELGFGTTVAMIEESWFWFLIWLAVGAFGVVSQLRWVGEVALPADRWARAEIASAPVAPAS